jgi:flagellar hook-associated protein 3 FlgL
MSSIRVNPFPMPDLLAALDNLQQQQSTATLELGTGSTINKPSDDPAGAAQLTLVNAASSQLDCYQQSIGSINSQLSTADSTLSSVVTVLQRAISLGVQGANGTLSDTDRAAIVDELSGIQSQLVSLANASYQGQYLFAGTAETQPFVVDPDAASGVSYKGNAGTNFVSIGNGYKVQVNLPGSQIFNGPGTDVFQAIHDLISALNANSGIPDAVTEVTNAYNYITSQRVFYGNAMNQAQTQQTFLDTEKVNLSQQENVVAGADMAGVASQLASDQTAINATLSAIGSMPRTSLFDYLK